MAIRIRCGIGCGVVCIGSGHGLPHLFCALQQRVAHFPAETRRPGKTGLGIVRFGFFQPGRANDHILVFAGVIAHKVPFRQGDLLIGPFRQVRWGCRDIVMDAQRVMHFLPEHRRLGFSRFGAQYARVAPFLSGLAIGEQQIPASSGERHVGESSFIAMVAAPVFLDLCKVQGIRIHGSDLIVEGTQCAKHFVIDGFRRIQQFQGLDGIRFAGRIMRESWQNAGIGAHRHGDRVDCRQP